MEGANARCQSSTPLNFDYPVDAVSIQKYALEALGDSSTEEPQAVATNKTVSFMDSETKDSDDPLPARENDSVEADEITNKKRNYYGVQLHKSSKESSSKVRTKKRQKDMPKRPLSAYNFFFQEERLSVLAEPKSDADLYAGMHTLAQQLHGGSNKAVSFEDLGKIVGRRWKALSVNARRKYDDMAQQDLIRYNNEMEIFQAAKRERYESEATYVPRNDPPSSNFNHILKSHYGPPPKMQSFPLRQNMQQEAPPRAVYGANNSECNNNHFSLPPGAEVLLRDESSGGYLRRYTIHYKFYTMTHQDARNYMESLSAGAPHLNGPEFASRSKNDGYQRNPTNVEGEP